MVASQASVLPSMRGKMAKDRYERRKPSLQIRNHSLMLRRYSAGCTTSGWSTVAVEGAVTARTETSGWSVLSVWSESNGIVGTSSACTDSAAITWEEAGAFLDSTIVSLDLNISGSFIRSPPGVK